MIIRYRIDYKIPRKNIMLQLRKKVREFIFPSEQVLESLKNLTFQSVLDVGAGTGFFLEFIDKNFSIKKGIGVEVNPSYFRKLNNRIEILSSVPENEQFDLICFNDVLHHVKDRNSYDIVTSYSEQYLKPGGHILIKDMSPEKFLYRNFNKVHDFIFSQEFIKDINPSEIEDICKAGFNIILKGEKRIFLYDHYFYLLKLH